MSNCKICFDKCGGGKVMRREIDDNNVLGNQEGCLKDPCVSPPIGEPHHLTIVAPAVFDECGINLCKVTKLPEEICEELGCNDKVQLEVIDIDFHITSPEGSRVEFISRRPNCIRVRLSNICVKFVAKVVDECGKILKTICFTTDYLTPDEDDPDHDPDTNPTSVTVELYAPYGVSYLDFECDECIPAINFLGFVQNEDGGNNALRQGLDVQALAKIIRLDRDECLAAIGLTLYLKTVYFVQYKIKHAGLCVPPKCVPIDEEVDNACMEFVEGDLLEQNIQPLEMCQRPRSFRRDDDRDGDRDRDRDRDHDHDRECGERERNEREKNEREKNDRDRRRR